jgi:hypothetical protein
MAGFLYYIPKLRTKPQAADLAAAQLGHLDGANLSYSPCLAGPDGAPGCVLAVDEASLAAGGKRPALVRYDAGGQAWQAGKTFWLGVEKNAPPREIDLRRPAVLPGHLVTMGDGQAWRVPCLRYLPEKMVLDDDGLVRREPLAAFAPMREQGRLLEEDYWDILAAARENQPTPALRLSDAGQMQLAIDYLSLNYRLGRVECNRLGLLTDSVLVKVIEAILDVPGLVKLLDESKKKTDAG